MCFSGLEVSLAGGKALLQIVHRERHIKAGGDHLARNPAIGDQGGPQHFVSAHDVVEGSLES